MTRLIHTARGSVRSRQISDVNFFAFVEGGLDRPFAERVLQKYIPSEIKYRIQAIKEVTNGTGGKPALLSKYESDKEAGFLLHEDWGKKSINVYFLDKDADDFLGRYIESPHVIYTSTYDVESDLFTTGDLVSALADTCLITNDQAKEIVVENKKWIRDIASNWSDWITLCLISQKYNLSIGCSFERHTDINQDTIGETDSARLGEYQKKAAKKLNISESDFIEHYNKTKDLVTQSIDSNEPLRFLKGKWLKIAIQECVNRHPKVPDANVNSVGDRIMSVLLGHIENAIDAFLDSHYANRIERTLSMIGNPA